MNLRASHSVSRLRIVLYVGKLYNFAYETISLNYANLSSFFPKMPGFITFSCRNYLHFQTSGLGTRGLNLGKERNHQNKITCNNGILENMRTEFFNAKGIWHTSCIVFRPTSKLKMWQSNN